jgi:hypothetical protein
LFGEVGREAEWVICGKQQQQEQLKQHRLRNSESSSNAADLVSSSASKISAEEGMGNGGKKKISN